MKTLLLTGATPAPQIQQKIRELKVALIPVLPHPKAEFTECIGCSDFKEVFHKVKASSVRTIHYCKDCWR